MKYFIYTPFLLENGGGYDVVQRQLSRRISQFVSLQICAPKKMRLSEEESQNFFESFVKKTESDLVIAFDERGESLDSVGFSKILWHEELVGSKAVHFCIGGAYGLPAALGKVKRLRTVALSAMTYCHELAFVNVLEQIYRARTIVSGHPYHHAGASDLMKALVKVPR